MVKLLPKNPRIVFVSIHRPVKMVINVDSKGKPIQEETLVTTVPPVPCVVSQNEAIQPTTGFTTSESGPSTFVEGMINFEETENSHFECDDFFNDVFPNELAFDEF